jgi:hypothetical protein
MKAAAEAAVQLSVKLAIQGSLGGMVIGWLELSAGIGLKQGRTEGRTQCKTQTAAAGALFHSCCLHVTLCVTTASMQGLRSVRLPTNAKCSTVVRPPVVELISIAFEMSVVAYCPTTDTRLVARLLSRSLM